MKKIILTALMAASLSFGSNAQSLRSEVHGGIGILSSSSIVDLFSDVLVTAVSAGLYSEEASFSVTTYLGYKYKIKERISIGATYAYAYGSSDAVINHEPAGSFRNNYHTAALELEYSWLLRPRLCLYSAVGVGATVFQQRYTPTEGETVRNSTASFDFQLSPIGIKYGEVFGFFAEAGFGYKGILSAGVFGRF